MKNRRARLGAAAAVFASNWLVAWGSQAAVEVNWKAPWREPRDRVAAEQRSDEYAWRLFVALNWPANIAARAADPSADFGADRPVVWETWATAGEVYLEDGRDPGHWARRARSLQPERRFETTGLLDLHAARHIVDGVMVPLVEPLEAAGRLTEIRMNRYTFDYIRARELYNVGGQLRAYGRSTRVSFPYGAKEVKATWRPIDPSQGARYHTTWVAFADGSRRLYGLTGLHVVSKDLPHWFWATFEHVDNPSLKGNEGWKLTSRDRFSCPTKATDCDGAPTTIGLGGTVWQYYRLRGSQTRFVDDQSQPTRLANSELESGFQRSASCMTCHSRSAVGVIAGVPSRLPVFDSSSAEEHDARSRRGFVGLPAADWFDPGTQAHFKSLDFVWSLSNAKAKAGSPVEQIRIDAHSTPSSGADRSFSNARSSR